MSQREITIGRSRPALRAAGLALITAAAVALAGCAAPDESTTGLTDVAFALPSNMGANNSPMAVAQGMGYFEDEGLDVEIVITGDSVPAVQGVTSGQFLIGSTSPEPVFQAQSKGGAEGNLTLFYNYIRKATGSIAVLEDSPIQSLEDFDGAVIGQASLGISNMQLSNGILSTVGLEDEVDFTNLAVGTGAQALQALETGQADALSLWDTEYAAMEARGAKLRFFTVPEVQQLFSTSYFATPESIADKGDTLAAFGRAMAKATVFASVNPEAALRIMYDLYPETRVAGNSVEQQLEIDLTALNVRLKLLTDGDPAANGTFGQYDPAAVQGWLDFAAGTGIVDTQMKADDVYTNTFVEKINDFDVAAVEEQARTWSEQ